MVDRGKFSVVEVNLEGKLSDTLPQKRQSRFRTFFKRKNDYKLIFISIAYISFVILTFVHRAYHSSNNVVQGSNPEEAHAARYKRDVTLFDDNFTIENGNFTSGQLGDEGGKL